MDNKELYSLILGNDYYSIDDLRYNKKLGFMLSKEEFASFLNQKDGLIDENYPYIKTVPLKTFNSKYCFFVDGGFLLSLKNEYMRLLATDYELNQSFLFLRNGEDILISRLFSEIEGTLSIENVPTTQKKIRDIYKSEKITDDNDRIVRNMLKAVEFIINEKPEFNKENLFKLYSILSYDSLPQEKRIKPGMYYRDDEVYIDVFSGASPKIIDECMDSLFAFANNRENVEKYDVLLPFICHYYILYVHPYFDYNGRTARMVSFWLNYINKIVLAPYFMSEAINENKKEYYNALTNTRLTNNDLTYFLGYILETSIKFCFVYKNLEEIKKVLSKTGDNLTSAEWVYVKKIIIHSPENYFDYKMFLKYISSYMTKQGATGILNNLSNYDILIKTKNKKGDTVYRLNQDLLVYSYNK